MKLPILALCTGIMTAVPAWSSIIDLSKWTKEGDSASGWDVYGPAHCSDPTKLDPITGGCIIDVPRKAFQTINGYPSVLLSNIAGLPADFSFSAGVNYRAGDDDFFGFVFGFQPGDFTNPDADYLLVDWKKSSQTRIGGIALKGLWLSRVTGIPTYEELFLHTDDATSDSGSVTQLAYGMSTISRAGWSHSDRYTFDIEYINADVKYPSNNRLKLSIDGFEELNVELGYGVYGNVGFYTNSQAEVSFDIDLNAVRNTQILPFTTTPVPEPSIIALFAAGLFGIGFARRRQP
jgi:hypothetical protein